MSENEPLLPGTTMRPTRDPEWVPRSQYEILRAERQQAIDDLAVEKETNRKVFQQLERQLQQAIDEVERLRDRAVCSGGGQDTDEGGACDTEGCDDGETE